MKKILFAFVILSFTATSANAQRKKSKDSKKAETIEAPAFVPQAEGPKIEFERVVHDYGQIEQGSNGATEFKFRNIGSEPLILSNVPSTCGCTVPEWSRQPIMPGDTGVVKVVYNTNNVGNIGRAVTVHSNSVDNTDRVTLRITGKVNPKQQ